MVDTCFRSRVGLIVKTVAEFNYFLIVIERSGGVRSVSEFRIGDLRRKVKCTRCERGA